MRICCSLNTESQLFQKTSSSAFLYPASPLAPLAVASCVALLTPCCMPPQLSRLNCRRPARTRARAFSASLWPARIWAARVRQIPAAHLCRSTAHCSDANSHGAGSQVAPGATGSAPARQRKRNCGALGPQGREEETGRSSKRSRSPACFDCLTAKSRRDCLPGAAALATTLLRASVINPQSSNINHPSSGFVGWP